MSGVGRFEPYGPPRPRSEYIPPEQSIFAGLTPLCGPRRTVGLTIAGEHVSHQDAITDQSEWIVAWHSGSDKPPTDDDVLGFVSQCEACGQRAITRNRHGGDWICPRCEEVTNGSGYGDLDCGLGLADDDGPDLGKVRI